ncbi:DEAD/DEAH box helicase family protein, partial [Acinetobacter baumannii]|nr:DEAD/DEAH box helicase family protein [Acinetobacter baumannii]
FDFAEKGNGIYRLSIPTGGGKTLSSMRYALELAKKENKEHIIYVAPFLSVLEQNADEIKTILKDDEN